MWFLLLLMCYFSPIAMIALGFLFLKKADEEKASLGEGEEPSPEGEEPSRRAEEISPKAEEIFPKEEEEAKMNSRQKALAAKRMLGRAWRLMGFVHILASTVIMLLFWGRDLRQAGICAVILIAAQWLSFILPYFPMRKIFQS